MIIGIDGNEANVEKRVGIGEYAYELLKEFEKLKRKDIEFVIYLKTNPLVDLPKQREGWKYRIVRPSKYWTQFGLPIDLFIHRPRPDVFFTPSHYAPRFSPVSCAISIMDVSYLKFPELFKEKDLYQLKNWTSYSAKKAKKIFTISNSSKNDIIREYGKKEKDVIVTYLGIKMDDKNNNPQNLEEKFEITKPYILFVGTLQPRKNIERLIEAFSKVPNEDVELVIVGKKGWLYENILSAPQKFGVSDKVKFLDFVKDEDLPVLYKNALCFVLPSLYEGFGLPVLEAMKYGCPVIVSNVSSLPEAAGDAALYVDPENVSDITEKIKKMIGDKNLREELRKKGYKQIEKFSWQKTASETLKVLEEIGNN